VQYTALQVVIEHVYNSMFRLNESSNRYSITSSWSNMCGPLQYFRE